MSDGEILRNLATAKRARDTDGARRIIALLRYGLRPSRRRTGWRRFTRRGRA